MNHANQRIIAVEYSIVALLLFVLPFFFVPVTFEFFATNKMYLLGYASLAILMTATFRLLIQKHMLWEKNILDIPVLIFLGSVGVSTLFASDNPIQAVLNPHGGLITLTSLTVIYFYVSRQEWEKRSINLIGILVYSACILSAIAALVFLGLFNAAWLPDSLQFLKNPLLTPAGTVFDLVAVLGYFVFYQILRIIYSDKAEITISRGTIISTIILTIGLAFSFLLLLKMSTNPTHVTEFAQFPISMKAAGSIFSQPGSFLFGVGVDDFSSAYTRVKDAQYNMGPLWQIDSFNISRSALLHILTETGLVGLLSFLGMIGALIYRITISSYPHKMGPLLLTLYLLISFIIFPASLLLYFLAYLTIAFTTCDLGSYDKEISKVGIKMNKKHHAPFLYTSVLLIFSIIIAAFYLLTRAYSADMAFRKSFDSLGRNDPQKLYENQRTAVILNPYIEQYRTHLAKTNVVIANEVAAGVQNDGKEASPEQKQIITEAIQAAISQAKAAVTLNPSKANNWESLGTVYANIIGIVKGSPSLTISVFDRAISLDPANARYYSKLGTVNYLTGNYNDAINNFKYAAELKPDWASAWYNLAWSYYKKGENEEAIGAITKAIDRIDRTNSPSDYEQALADLETFKKTGSN